MNNLIKLYGLSERKGEPVVGSRKVAEVFKKEHKHVLEAIEKAFVTFEKIGKPNFRLANFIESTYKDEQNKKRPEYLLNEKAFSYIAMGFTGARAAEWKINYIEAFNQMKDFIESLTSAKLDHPAFTQAIMDAHTEPKHYHFSAEADMINRIVLGVPAKKFREANGIEKGKSIRPYLAPDQIKAIEYLQRIDIGLIIAIPDYQERKQKLADVHEFNQNRLVQIGNKAS